LTATPTASRIVGADVVGVTDPSLITIRLTPECWRFVDDARAWPALFPLPADVHGLFDRPPHIEISGPLPEPRFVVHTTRRQAEALQRWLHALHDDLKHDETRRLACLLCISRVAVGIILAER
jgi:hypothetical protein